MGRFPQAPRGRKAMAYSCRTCGETFQTAQGVRGHQNRHRKPNLSPEPVEPRFDLDQPNLGEPVSDEIKDARERLQLRKIEEENRAMDARAERREQEKLAELLRAADQARQDRIARESAKRRAEEARQAAQAEERRRQQARDARIDQGKKLADRLLEANNVDVFARWRIRAEIRTALEKAAENELIENVVNRVLAGEFPLPKATEPARTPQIQGNLPVLAAADVDEFEDDEADEALDDDSEGDDPEEGDEPADDDEPGPAGWGTLLTLGAVVLGVAVLAKALKAPTVWLSDPATGGDGSFAVGPAPPGSNPPWRAASPAEIQRGLESGALRVVEPV